MRTALIATLSAAALIVGGFAATASAQNDNDNDQPGTIVEVASGDDRFSTLVSAVQAAGLVDTLSGDGPFTVFAPTNEAFEALPEGTLESLLEDPEGALTEVLQLHVVQGEVRSDAAQEAAGSNVDTLGGPVRVEQDGDNLIVGGATVIEADIDASNGVIHAIDAVITEPAEAEAPPAEPEQPAEPAPGAEPPADDPDQLPTRIDAGGGGGAAQSSSNGVLLGLIAAGALAGLIASAYGLSRREQ